MYEAIDYFKLIKTDEFGYKSYSDEGLVFAANILDKMNKLKDEFPVDYQQNIECIPGETCAKIFCKKDFLLYGEENNVPAYSNQWIPLVERCSIKEKLRLGALLDKKCGGGQITHINIDKPFSTPEQAWRMLNTVAESGVIYFAFNTVMSECKNKHVYYGDICPECGCPTLEQYTRIVGFITPIRTWSKERREEFPKRNFFVSENL